MMRRGDGKGWRDMGMVGGGMVGRNGWKGWRDTGMVRRGDGKGWWEGMVRRDGRKG